LSFSGTLGSRASQSALYFERYGITVFGSQLKINSGTTGWSAYTSLYTLDNSYLYLLLGYGLVFFVLYILGEIILFRKCAKSKNFMMMTVLALYAMYGLMETVLIRIDCNFTLIFLTYVLWRPINKNKLRNKEEQRLEHNVHRA
jgi:hypothetical protein